MQRLEYRALRLARGRGRRMFLGVSARSIDGMRVEQGGSGSFAAWGAASGGDRCHL